MSIDPRLRYNDNLGALPCIDPLTLGRLMDRLCEGSKPSLESRVRKALAQLRRRIAK